MTPDDDAGQCEIDAEARLEARIAAARPRPSESAALRLEIREAVAHEAACDARDGDEIARRGAQFRKWRLIHKLVHGQPFRDRRRIPRSAQWSEALDRVRELRDTELIDWVGLQIEVARNIEKGVRDLRPRKGGPTYLVLLEYVANRKRKALAVLHWAEAAEAEGCYRVDSEFHARTGRILAEHALEETEEDGNPLATTEPMARS